MVQAMKQQVIRLLTEDIWYNEHKSAHLKSLDRILVDFMVNDEFDNMDIHFMKLAIGQAKKAAKINEVPIGCVIVYDGKIIGLSLIHI